MASTPMTSLRGRSRASVRRQQVLTVVFLTLGAAF